MCLSCKHTSRREKKIDSVTDRQTPADTTADNTQVTSATSFLYPVNQKKGIITKFRTKRKKKGGRNFETMNGPLGKHTPFQNKHKVTFPPNSVVRAGSVPHKMQTETDS